MKTKNQILFLLTILTSVIFSSCTKVINIDLKDSQSLYVIEGEVNSGELVHFVTITKSIKFSDINSFPAVSAAVVVLSDDIGNSEVLSEVSPGKYASTSILGVEGRTYTLSVKIDGKEFVSSSTMPAQINLDTVAFIDIDFKGVSGKIPVPIRQDPAGIKNYYRFDMYVNRFEKNKGWERDSLILVQDDEFSDGLVSQQPLFGSIGSFMPNDSCKVNMMCIDKNVYKYFFSLNLNSPGGSATPANPVSNISGGCLGYFAAQTKQSLTFVVQ